MRERSGLRRVRRPSSAHSPAFDLGYVRSGPRGGTPIVVIPGGPGLASVRPYRSLRRQAASGGLDLIMVEHRGVGYSRDGLSGHPLPQSAMRIADVVDDIAAVLDREGVETAFVAGSSYGSYLASAFGVRHGDRVAGMLLDSALQSAGDIPIERQTLRSLFWDADTAVAGAVRRLSASGMDDRVLLDVVRAAYELAGEGLLERMLRNRVRGRASPAWAILEKYAARDESIARIPGHYEFTVAGTIGFRELGYGARPDGLPLDPALTYAPIAHRFPPFAGESFDLPAATVAFRWPMVLLVGTRDLRTPREIAQRVADTARDATLVMIENGHSALDTHPLAFLNAVRQLARGRAGQLPAQSGQLDRLPRRGLAASLVDALEIASRMESALRR